MSLQIIKAGLLDTIQDDGRTGYSHLGINPGGVMDAFSYRLANALLGKNLTDAVIELHFPAAQIVFTQSTIICVTGADFMPRLNNITVPINHPIVVGAGCTLRFDGMKQGARAYLSVKNEWLINKWLDSFSTNKIAGVGGWQGRPLQKGDCIEFANALGENAIVANKQFKVLPWSTGEKVDNRNEIEFVIGSEWHCLTNESQIDFQNSWFQITQQADRMGYQLSGCKLSLQQNTDMLSSAVSFGTVQLLPNGQVIILMADHQTTGGYPRIAHIISAHLPLLAQKNANDVLKFVQTNLETAEEKIMKQERYLQQLQEACKFRLEEWLHAH
ncbi:MAG: biotin-dependent carboxyltransferase family protein [Bacteroidota bacterium]